MHKVRTQRIGAGPRKQVIVRAAAAAAGVVLAAASASRAADIHWNSADGNWNVPENWLAIDPNPPAVPGPADRAIIDLLTGGTARVTTDLADDVLSISVQNGNVLSVESGGIVGTTAAGASASDTIRIGDASAGSAIVLDGGTLRNNTLSGLGADIYVGVLAGGVGTFSQSGATSVVFARDMRIGSDTGTGSYTLSGGSLQTNWTIVGRVGGTGTLTVDGGTILAKNSAAAELRVADGAASTGTVNFLSGTIDTTGQVNVGFGSGSGVNLGSGTGTMTHTGGLLTTINTMSVGRGGNNTGGNRGFGTYILGADASSTAAIDVNFTPAVPPAGPTNGHFVIGMNGGKGDMTMNGGSITTDSGFYVGFNDGGNINNRSEGSLALHGGTATVGGMFHVGYESATGSMTMDGGTISVTGVSGVGFDDRTNNARTTLTLGNFTQTGGTINANGGFTVARGSGSGTYTLDSNAVLNVGTGTTGDLLIGQTDAVTAAHTMSGNLNLTGNASVTVAGGLRIGVNGGKGTLTTTGGTLAVTGNSLVGDGGAGAVAVANLGGGTATFAGSLTAGDGQLSNGTLNITAGTLNVTGALVAGRQTTVGGVINQSGGTVTSGSVGVRTGTGTAALIDFNLSGGVLNTGTVTNNSTFDASGTGIANVGAIGGSGSITVADTASVTANSVRQASLTMTGGTLKIRETNTGLSAGTSVVPNYTLSGSAKWDLTDNKLITSKSVGAFAGGVYGGVQGDVQKAYNFGAWDQPGLMTSKPDAGPLVGTTTIGVSTGEAVLFLGPTETGTFGGQTVTGASTIAMYTYAGDLNFDGLVDAADYGVIDNWVQFPGTDGYANGDFNYDGVIDAGDYGIIDNTIQLQGAPIPVNGGSDAGMLSAGVTAVPEPSGLVLLLAPLASLARRRRSRVRA